MSPEKYGLPCRSAGILDSARNIGIILGKKIPERTMKWVAAILFIGFGLYGLYEYVAADFWNAPLVIGGLVALAGSIWLAARNATPPALEQTCPVEQGKD